MSQQQVAEKSVAASNQQDAATSIVSSKQEIAFLRITRAFKEGDPLSFVGNLSPELSTSLIDRLVVAMQPDVTFVRLQPPYSSELAMMRQVINGIGFESKDLCLTDLENVFTMFLSFQKSHQNRTVLCVQDAMNCEPWLLDRIRWFVQAELRDDCGLKTLVTGRRSLSPDEYFAPPPVPSGDESFSLSDTRVFVSKQIEAAGTSDIARVFEFAAITLLHELAEGNEDSVTELYLRCLQLSESSNTRPITEDMVRQAQRSFETVADDDSPEPRRITVRVNGEVTRHLPLDDGHILVGRDALCDIRVTSRAVSRHHALIVNSSGGITIIDLGSTNGTFVDGQQVSQHELTSGGVITVGDCNMEYVAGGDDEPWKFDLESANDANSADSHHATQTLKCEIKGNINAKGEKIYHVIGTALYDKTQIDESKGERWFHSEEEAKAAGWRKSRR